MVPRSLYKHLIQATGFLAGCLAIYSWVTMPSASVDAEVYFADFELPTAIAQQFAALTPLMTPDHARAEFFKAGTKQRILGEGGTVEQVLSNVSAYLKEKVPALQNKNQYLFKGYWRISVRNPGTRAASNVVLHFPIEASGVVSRPRADPAPLQQLPASTAQVFTLGNIQGGEDQVIVYAWTLSPATEDQAKKITLTHDLGAGRVRIVR